MVVYETKENQLCKETETASAAFARLKGLPPFDKKESLFQGKHPR